MPRLIGHTMATPEMSLLDAIGLFSSMGLDGIEIACLSPDEVQRRFGKRPGGPPEFFRAPLWPGVSDTFLRELSERSRAKRLPFVTLTPYEKNFNHADDTIAAGAVAVLESYVDLAARLKARFLRVYGGSDQVDMQTGWRRGVESLVRLAATAAARGVTLLLENHPGTMTVTGEATARLVREVANPALRALYDPANVLMHSDEPWRRTFDVQRDIIQYVHVKDFVKEGEKKFRATVVGEGQVPWREILAELKPLGADLHLSFEYERLWQPDILPPAADGVARSVAFVRDRLTA